MLLAHDMKCYDVTFLKCGDRLLLSVSIETALFLKTYSTIEILQVVLNIPLRHIRTYNSHET